MNRRTFMALSAAGAASLSALSGYAEAEPGAARDYYELRQYHVETEEQAKGVMTFLGEAMIPALNRLGVHPAGVFQPADGFSPVYLLLRYASLDVFSSLNQKLLADPEYTAKGAAFLDAPAAAPAYKRVESALLLAFAGMPHLDTPAKSPDRVLQLRIYESPSVKTGQKKIEMFNTAEIGIFRRTGLNAVFFGETLAGGKMPNLTYMLAFENMEDQQAAWDRFRADPEWLKLRAMPEYDDKVILCGITNLFLKAAPCSQI